MLTPAQMEQELKNIDRRGTAIEQILPTLATKKDLEPLATNARLDAAVTRTEALIESVRDDIRIVAEAVVSLTERLGSLAERLERKGVIERAY